MKVLLIGSGGREHALFWKLSQSPKCSSIHLLPGNGGIPPQNLISERLDLKDHLAILRHVERQAYDLVVVGPEQPLVEGIADLLAGVCPVFGPSQAAAALEGSKWFAKSFMAKYGIPTATARHFSDWEEAASYVQTIEPPIVIKADGLAAGKGVTVAWEHRQALTALREALIEKKFAAAGQEALVLIEEYLAGEELSLFALCDGERFLPLQPCQDYKRAYEGDKGPNTGGMGAYTPVPIASEGLMQQIYTEILEPTVRGMKAEGIPYRGLLYVGLMVAKERARVVEFNVRFGDPETQALVRVLEADLLELLWQAACGRLQAQKLTFSPQAALTTVLAAKGYPGKYREGILLKEIESESWHREGIAVFHAGTERRSGRLLSRGGRVLNVTATADSLEEARQKVESCIEDIIVPDLFYRRDIGLRSKERY